MDIKGNQEDTNKASQKGPRRQRFYVQQSFAGLFLMYSAFRFLLLARLSLLHSTWASATRKSKTSKQHMCQVSRSAGSTESSQFWDGSRLPRSDSPRCTCLSPHRGLSKPSHPKCFSTQNMGPVWGVSISMTGNPPSKGNNEHTRPSIYIYIYIIALEI